MGFGNGDVLARHVNDNHRIRELRHVCNAAQSRLQLVEVTADAGNFLLGEVFKAAVRFLRLEFLHVFDTGENNLLVRQRAAEPAVAHIRHIQAFCDFTDAFLSLALGADEQKARAALTDFPGVERRLQRIGRCGEAMVFDDYAHNPEKLHAMLTTLQAQTEKGVAVVWRPHGYGPLRKMLEPLAAMFSATLRSQDRLILLPVYDAGGTADRSVQSDALAVRVSGSVFLETPEEVYRLLMAQASAFGAIVTAGARDPGLPVLAGRLAGKEVT